MKPPNVTHGPVTHLGRGGMPTKIKAREDVVQFLLHLYVVDRVSFHPDDRFYDATTGEVQYVDANGRPCYTPEQAQLRDVLMDEAWAVSVDSDFDLYSVGLAVGAALGMYDAPRIPWVDSLVEQTVAAL